MRYRSYKKITEVTIRVTNRLKFRVSPVPCDSTRRLLFSRVGIFQATSFITTFGRSVFYLKR